MYGLPVNMGQLKYAFHMVGFVCRASLCANGDYLLGCYPELLAIIGDDAVGERIEPYLLEVLNVVKANVEGDFIIMLGVGRSAKM